MLNIFRRGNARPGSPAPAKSSPKANVKPASQPVTDLTIEYLKEANPDDILELMYPALVQEQQKRLSSTAKELGEIDQKLAKLYAERDDVYSVMTLAQNQNNGATDF